MNGCHKDVPLGINVVGDGKINNFLSLSQKKTSSHKQVLCIESRNVFLFNNQHEDNISFYHNYID
jgi:hypothetical protein